MEQKYDEKTIKDMSLRFLVCCYFGRSDNLLKAVIDRAYVDMASHTLKGFKENYEDKWTCRYNATNVIFKRIKEYPCNSASYDDWHNKSINQIIDCYKTVTLHEGQAQKWLNMTIKYLYVLKTLFENDYSRLKEAESFLKNTNHDNYLPPVDSYVLNGGELTNYNSWSNIDDYKPLKQDMKDNGFDFLWELENWESFLRQYPKNDDLKSYARHVKIQEKEGKIIPF